MRTLTITGAAVAVSAIFLTTTTYGRSLQFVAGGALVNLGYRMQDHLTSYDFAAEHAHDITPEEIWEELVLQNAKAAGVRRKFPRTARHPLVALVACMDARIDTNELTGDTRKYYYVLRTAGSVLDDKEAEMLELCVENGVKLIVLTTHTECAAEATAANKELHARYPALVKAVFDRDLRVQQLLSRPAIAERIARGELAVKRMNIDTMTEELRPVGGEGQVGEQASDK
ncbi:MAG: hypothetical protein H6835_13395 [Planctomycetes bacterium]|nr:hypothetical protein [Planctomycetota bacterium]